jgi:hypothetical protein
MPKTNLINSALFHQSYRFRRHLGHFIFYIIYSDVHSKSSKNRKKCSTYKYWKMEKHWMTTFLQDAPKNNSFNETRTELLPWAMVSLQSIKTGQTMRS